MDEVWTPPAVATRAADGSEPRSLAFDPEKHLVFSALDDEEDATAGDQSSGAGATSSAAPSRDGRGRYDRSNSAKRQKHVSRVMEYIEQIFAGNLLGFGVTCAPSCPQGGQCLENVCTLSVLKQCAAQSFGMPALLRDWDNITKNHTAVEQWFQLAHGSRVVDQSGNVLEIRYAVGDRRVCAPAWAAMRGIPPATGNTIDHAVRSGENVWNDGSRRAIDNARKVMAGNFTTAAATWWRTRLNYYEFITKKGTIMHPRGIIWRNVYEKEFVPEMRSLGHPWKLPAAASATEGRDQCSESHDRDDACSGSMSTWYDGKKAALVRLAQDYLGADSAPFKFVSRAKHSAYKECHLCQTGRLAIDEAIRLRFGPDVIAQRKANLASHLQWMYRQRETMERLIQMAGHEGCLAENSDKCGDHCLYLPASARASSANVSKFKYRLSLQANVYAGKLFNLMFLLPNLKTGADFGITSFLSSLSRMFNHGEVTNQTRRLFRGMDGGSENVNFAGAHPLPLPPAPSLLPPSPLLPSLTATLIAAVLNTAAILTAAPHMSRCCYHPPHHHRLCASGLGMNSLLVHELHEGSINEIQQYRLPPDHSHYFLTDGTFSVIEGWLTADGFPGCATVWELIAYLREKFADATMYKDKRIEITCLLVTFAFTKFFDGHINQDKIKKIGALPAQQAHRPTAPPLTPPQPSTADH